MTHASKMQLLLCIVMWNRPWIFIVDLFGNHDANSIVSKSIFDCRAWGIQFISTGNNFRILTYTSESTTWREAQKNNHVDRGSVPSLWTSSELQVIGIKVTNTSKPKKCTRGKVLILESSLPNKTLSGFWPFSVRWFQPARALKVLSRALV